MSRPTSPRRNRAAIKARDLESMRDYIVSLVDAMDDLPVGKYDAPVPRYVPPDAVAQAPAPATAPNGRYLESSLM